MRRKKTVDKTAILMYFYRKRNSMDIHDYTTSGGKNLIKDGENVYFLHACQKQKDKAEKFEIDTALKRAKEIKLNV